MHLTDGAVTGYTVSSNSFDGLNWANSSSTDQPQGTFPTINRGTMSAEADVTHEARNAYQFSVSLNTDLRAHSTSVASIQCTLRLVYLDFGSLGGGTGTSVAIAGPVVVQQPTFVPDGLSGERHIKVQNRLSAELDSAFGLTVGNQYCFGVFLTDLKAFDSSGTQIAPGASSSVNLGGYAKLIVTKA